MENSQIKEIEQYGICGSYNPGDVDILLELTEMKDTDVAEKEKLIQTGEQHYSQMISIEKPPSSDHMDFFWATMDMNGKRMAEEVQKLGNTLMSVMNPDKPIILVSLVRAGLPLGVLLKRYIEQTQSCCHYGISIILGRGIDFAALNLIINKHGRENIVFVDGWTGKGAITKELTASLKAYPELFDNNTGMPRLVTLIDLGGVSWLSVSADDWVIPSGILGGVVSGLVSRSILKDDITQNQASKFELPENWHKCVIYDHLKEHDVTLEFVDRIYKTMCEHPTTALAVWGDEQRVKQHLISASVIEKISSDFSITNMNRIKPGIAEATRAVMRRLPEQILVKDINHPSLGLILRLIRGSDVSVTEVGDYLGPYEVVTLIKNKGGIN